MKKILSNLTLIFTTPFRLIKKVKFNNFIGGLIFGAIFSLVVNLITVQVQELILKQRILEAIENEIATNFLQANNTIGVNNEALTKSSPVNFFYIASNYSSDLWSQSSEPLQYIAQLDQEVQIAVVLYYSLTIKNANNLIERTNQIIIKTMDLCFSLETATMKSDDQCRELNKTIRNLESSAAQSIGDDSYKVLKIFHPTKDRLESRLLKLMMGNKSIRMLSGE